MGSIFFFCFFDKSGLNFIFDSSGPNSESLCEILFIM